MQEQLVTLLERRLVAGETAALDVARERINLNQIAISAREVKQQAADARAKLGAAVGVPARAFEGVEPSLAAFEQPAQAPDLADLAAGALRRQALLQRADFRGLLAKHKASQSALKLEVARQYPNLTLGTGYTYDQGDNLFTLGLGADLPIFSQNQGPIAEAQARRREAAARFRVLQAKIIGEVDVAIASYRSAMPTVATADALQEGAARRRQQIDRVFRLGEVDRSAPLTADLELAGIELLRFEALAQQGQALEPIGEVFR